jgi:putative tryptophan/tyrosine transport system substrate-binding protein
VRRREFITLVGGATAAWPLEALAQQSAMPVIGFLSIRSQAADEGILTSFRQALSDLGYVEGRNVTIEYRFAKGEYNRLPELAADLVNRKVTVIVTTGGAQSAIAAKRITATIPIVFTSGGDPVAEGLVQSLSHPGGNLTGITTSFGETASKRIGLLHDLLPAASTVALLVNPIDQITGDREISDIQEAARTLGKKVEVLKANNESEIDRAFVNLVEMRADALIVATSPLFVTRASQLVSLAASNATPTLYFRREFAVAGGLMSYGSNLADLFRVVGNYTGRILKGEKPGDLPVQLPTKFDLVINLKTAKALGLEVPAGLLARADDVIE